MSAPGGRAIPIVATARHVRLQASHLELLFGPKHALTALAPLALPGVFACAEGVNVRGPSGSIAFVRVVGPVVRNTTVRVSPRDLPLLGLPAEPLPRTLAESRGCTIEGPAGTVVLAEGLVTPRRVLSLDPSIAARRGLDTGASTTLVLASDRSREILDVRVQLVDGAQHLSVDLDDPLAHDAWTHAATWPSASSVGPGS